MKFKTLFAAAVLSMVSVGAVHNVGQAPLIVAHRGASFDAPENTMASFKLGYEQNADGIESDFWLTKDGKIACTHDSHFKRTAGVDKDLHDMTLAEVEELDVGKWKGAKFAGQHPPKLSEIFELVKAQGPSKLFFLEIKCGGEIVPELKREIEAAKFPLEQLRVISFQEDAVKAVKEQWPSVKAYWLTDFKKDKKTKKPTLTTQNVLDTLKACHATGLDCQANLDVLTPAFVKEMKDNGFELHAWTVDQPEVAKKLVELGFESITTNKPGMIRAALK